jgi:hypothetical protein
MLRGWEHQLAVDPTERFAGADAWVAYQTNRSGAEGCVWLSHPGGTEDHLTACRRMLPSSSGWRHDPPIEPLRLLLAPPRPGAGKEAVKPTGEERSEM